MPPTIDSPAEFAFCPHDRGPGISVCLRCRADAHRKAAETRRRIAARAGIAVASALVLAVAGNSVVAARGASVHPGGAAEASAPAERFQVTQAGTSEPSRVAVPDTRALPAPTIAIAEGRTDLGEGRWAERSGDSVTVHFDTPVYRTRHVEKFEQVVRATLPAVYGAAADSALASVPAGDLGAVGDLLTELPARGIQLPVRDGWRLTLWPGTRPGQDGPLVVRYRVSIARAE